MRKSNVIIIVILMVSSIFFLWLWNFLKFNLIDMRDLIITILWWIITAALCYAIYHVEKKRRERLRTVFIADGILYNAEAGLFRIDDTAPDSYVEGLRELLNGLNYDPKAKPDSDNVRLRFNYIVHSPKFKDDGKTWEGEVVKVRGGRDTQPFADEQQLTKIFAEKNI